MKKKQVGNVYNKKYVRNNKWTNCDYLNILLFEFKFRNESTKFNVYGGQFIIHNNTKLMIAMATTWSIVETVYERKLMHINAREIPGVDIWKHINQRNLPQLFK